MSDLYVLVIDPEERDFNRLKQQLIEHFERSFKYINLGFYHESSLTKGLETLRYHSNQIGLIIIDPKIALRGAGEFNTVGFHNLVKIQNLIGNAKNPDAGMLYIGEQDSIEEAAYILQRADDKKRLIRRDDKKVNVEERVLEEISKYFVARSSGPAAENHAIAIIEHKLNQTTQYLTGLVEDLQQDLQEIEDAYKRLNFALFSYDPQVTKTPPLIHEVRQNRQNIAFATTQRQDLLKQIVMIRNEAAVHKRRLNELDRWKTQIQNRQNKLMAIGGGWANTMVTVAISIAVTSAITWFFK